MKHNEILNSLVNKKVLVKILDEDNYYYNDTDSNYTFTAEDVEYYSEDEYYIYEVYKTGLSQHTHYILELHER